MTTPNSAAATVEDTLRHAIHAVTISGNHGDDLVEAIAAVDRYLAVVRATGDNPYDVLDATLTHQALSGATTPEILARRLDRTPTAGLVAILADSTETGLMSDTWRSMTCYEAEAVAALMRRYGRPEAAATVIIGHALADDSGDLHTP